MKLFVTHVVSCVWYELITAIPLALSSLHLLQPAIDKCTNFLHLLQDFCSPIIIKNKCWSTISDSMYFFCILYSDLIFLFQFVITRDPLCTGRQNMFFSVIANAIICNDVQGGLNVLFEILDEPVRTLYEKNNHL